MTPRIGTMQGRLVPPEEGRFQSFPAQRWRDEFLLAREAGLDCIEWIYEERNADRNPLGSDSGVAEMKDLIAASGVAVRSICADYYMTRHLVTRQGFPDPDVVAHLRWLIGRASLLKITYVVLPFVDSSSLRTSGERAALASALAQVISAAEQADVELHLETDLPPDDFAATLRAIGHPRVRANYDMGNSAALGYDQAYELKVLAPWIGSVHVKDRLRGGGTVPLGTGNADLPACFRGVHAAGFERWYILQVARSKAGEEVLWLRGVRQFVAAQIAAAAS